jgi:chloramphenicol-sensitive protein RarD
MSRLRAIFKDRRTALLLTAAALLVAINWGVYIYAVNSSHVIEGSLGYFINPLVSVAFGVVIFREKLSHGQIAALAIASLAIVALTIDYGRLPWIALTLAVTFGTYGLVKKIADVGAAESLAFETLVLLAPALGYVIALELNGTGTLGHEGVGHTLLLIAAGPVTAIPLLLFAGAVTRIPLSLVGILQYITPTMQFLVGWLLLGEDMPAGRWVGFVLVWTALVVFSVDALRTARRSRAEPRPEYV